MATTNATVIQELEQLRAEVTALKTERDALAPFKAQVGELNDKLTARTNELAAEKSAHAETNLKLVTSETAAKATKTELDALKTNTEAEITKRVSAEVAKAAAAQGIPPVAVKPNTDHSKVAEVQKSKKISRKDFATEVEYQTALSQNALASIAAGFAKDHANQPKEG